MEVVFWQTTSIDREQRLFVLDVVTQKIKNIFVNTFVIAISCTIAIILGEIYFRVFRPQIIIPRYVETSLYGIRKNIGNVHGEMITPVYRHKFNTNSQGFRGKREYLFKKASNILG